MLKPLKKWLVEALFSVSTNYNHYNRFMGVFLLVVYADVLIFINLIINYFLLLSVAKIMHKTPKTLRLVAGACFGAVSSLYIFLPTLAFWLEAVFKAAVCFIICLITFGFNGTRNFLKSAGLLFGVTMGFGVAMYAVWLTFSPKGMVINNSVVYFDISLVALLIFTVLAYVIFSLLFKIFSKVAPLAARCEITVFANGKSVNLIGIVDSGNSIEDVFSLGEIIICNKSVMTQLFGQQSFENECGLKTRYRMLPCSTITGVQMLEGVRCDKAVIEYNGKMVELKRPILAFSKTEIVDNEAIINPKILG